VVRDGEINVQVMHNGVSARAGGYHGAWMAEIIWRLRGHHEPQEEAIFHEIVKLMPDAPSMIELGSFWAYYSLWLLQFRPAASTIGVELNRTHLEIGRRNAALNGRTMTFIDASVGA
jgi:predicted O-methyltransferase YrrM